MEPQVTNNTGMAVEMLLLNNFNKNMIMEFISDLAFLLIHLKILNGHRFNKITYKIWNFCTKLGLHRS